MKKILITGGGGFIGSHIVEALQEYNEITILDDFTQNAIQYLGDISDITLIKGSVLDRELLTEIEKETDFDIVIHMAAIAGVKFVEGNPTKTMMVNLIGTYNVLETFKEANLERFVNFSTSEVYGTRAVFMSEEDDTTQGAIGKPRPNYAVSKISAEHLGYTYMQEYGLPFVSIRPYNCFGSRQIGGGSVRIFTEQAVKGENLVVFGDGMGIRCYCYVSDFMDGLLATLEKPEAIGQVFNIGNPYEPIASITLAKKIIALANSDSQIIFDRTKKEDVLVRIPKIEKAQRILNFEPKVSLEEGLKKTIEWWRERNV